MAAALIDLIIQQYDMFTRLYVEALLADEVLADQVWEVWHAGLITDKTAAWGWYLIQGGPRY